MSSKIINIKGKLCDLSHPVVMGILNITPDSFFDGGKYFSESDKIKARIDQILAEGGKIIDIGAYSSRPGADDVSEDEEYRRLARAFDVIAANYSDLTISVDTFRSGIARKAVLEFGADIINDISAGEIDKNMFTTVAELNVPYILMHMQGRPADMQDSPTYADVVEDIVLYLSRKVMELRQLGVKDIIIDPGFGFGKTLEQNYALLNRLEAFDVFELPLLVGISRKSMIYKLLNKTPQESLNGTTVLNTLALTKGASILRVHDVKEAVECVTIFEALKG